MQSAHFSPDQRMKTGLLIGGVGLAVVAGLFIARAAAPGAPGGSLRAKGARPTFFPVKRLASKRQPPPGKGKLRIGSGRFFSFALPPGWRLGEDGQFALSLIAPDDKAFTVLVGNAGLPPNYSPAQYVYEKLMAMRPTSLQLGPPRPARPAAGFTQAVEFEVSYVSPAGNPTHGLAKCNTQVAYDTALFAMTAAVSVADQWEGYASWLPAVAEQISANNGAAFGVRGVMAQNLKNSTAYAEAARSYRDWSQRNWQQVTDERGRSQDRINQGVREEILGGVKPYANPYGEKRPVELPLDYSHYWMNRQGKVVGTDDPSANPNDGSTSEWRQMKQERP